MENLDCLICLVGVRNAVLCPKCSKVFCRDCVSRLYETLRPTCKKIVICPHCQAALLEKDFVKINWLNDLRKDIAQIPESFVDKCRKHPQRQGSLHCVPCDRSFCMECRKGDHRGTEHQVESVELLHEKIAEEWGNRKEGLEAIHGVIDDYREDEKKIDELLAEGEQRIDLITQQMIKRLREEVLSVRNRHNAAYPQLNVFTQRSSPLVDSVKSAAEATILNRLVEQRPKLKELGSIIDETVDELRGANDKPQYAVLKIPDVLSILEPWTPNWVIDEIVDIPKREPGYPCGFSRHLTAVERGSLPPFVMKLVLTSGSQLYARLVAGPQKLSNIEFVIESVTPRLPGRGHKPAYRHAFVPQGDFAKSEFLNLHWRWNGLQHCFVNEDFLIAHFRIRVRPRDYSQIQRIKSKVDDDEDEDDDDVAGSAPSPAGTSHAPVGAWGNNNDVLDDDLEEGEIREMRHEGPAGSGPSSRNNNNDTNEYGDGATGYDPSSSKNNNNTDNDTAKNNNASSNTTDNDDTDSVNNARSIGCSNIANSGSDNDIVDIKTEMAAEGAGQRIESQRRILRKFSSYEEICITEGGETVKRGENGSGSRSEIESGSRGVIENGSANECGSGNENGSALGVQSGVADGRGRGGEIENGSALGVQSGVTDGRGRGGEIENGSALGVPSGVANGSGRGGEIENGSALGVQSGVADGSGRGGEIENGSALGVQSGVADGRGRGGEIENGSALGVPSGVANGSGRGSDIGNGSGSGSGIVGECRVKPSNKREKTGNDSVESDDRKKKKKHEGDA